MLPLWHSGASDCRLEDGKLRWNTLQIAIPRLLSKFSALGSCFEGNRLVVWGKGTRGLGEINMWSEGNDTWFEGNLARGSREIARGSREVADEKCLQTKGVLVGFWVLLLFKSLLFLFANNNRGRM